MLDFGSGLKTGLCQAQAKILKAPREDLAWFLDIPLVPVGDLYKGWVRSLLTSLQFEEQHRSSARCLKRER